MAERIKGGKKTAEELFILAAFCKDRAKDLFSFPTIPLILYWISLNKSVISDAFSLIIFY